MKIEKFVKPKDCEIRYQKYLFLRQNFNKSCLKARFNIHGKDDYSHSADYKKLDEYLPLLFVIPQFYGRIYVVNDESYLYMCDVSEKFGTLSDYEKFIIEVIRQINEIKCRKYGFKKDYCKIKLGSSIKKMPVGVMLKISYTVVWFNLVLERKRGLLVEGLLQECFYESLDEEVINDEFEIIESKK